MSDNSKRMQQELTPAEWDLIDQQVKLFERAWRADDVTRFDRALERSDGLRSPMLIELLRVDIEFMLRSGQATGIDNYLRLFPELSDNSQAVADLLLHEWHIKKARQPELSLSQLVASVPGLAEAVRETSATQPDSRSIQRAADAHQEGHQAWPSIPGYQFLEVLGRGGMGIVYLAFDVKLKRHVAIKMLLKGALATPQELSRFWREAEAVAALQHPQVLRVYHIGEYAGQPFIVLEYAPGGSLNRQLNGRPIDARRAAEIMRGLAQAVATAHAAHIIHRDLKPANVLLDADGLAKIADFGLAKRLSTDLNLTEDDLLICTPSYAAPERIFQAGYASAPTMDIYSLGAILFELLTGRPPFVGASIMEVLENARSGDAIAPRRLVSSIPRDLETICMKCLQREPGKRYATALELAEDLRRYLERQPVTARPVSVFSRLASWGRRNPLLAASCCLSALLLVATTAISLTVASVLAQSTQAEKSLRELTQRAQQSALANEQRAMAEAAAANESIRFIEELLAATDLARRTNDDLELMPSPLVVEVSTRQIVELGIARLETALRQHPLARARVLTTVGATALNVGMVLEARPLLMEAIALYQSAGQGRSLAAVESQIGLARIEAANQNYSQAHDLFESSSQLLRELAATDSMLQADIGVYQAWMGLTWKNRAYLEDQQHPVNTAVKIKTRRFGRLHPQTVLARTIATLTQAMVTQDRDASLKAMEELWLEIKDVPISNFVKAIVLGQMASLCQRTNSPARATQYIEHSLAQMTRAIGDHDHPVMSGILSDAAWIAHGRGAIRVACTYQEQALRMRERCLGEDSETSELRNRLIDLLNSVGEFERAQQVRQQAGQAAGNPSLGSANAGDDDSAQGYDEAATRVRAELANYEAVAWTSMIEMKYFELAEIEVLRGNFAEVVALYDQWLSKKPSLPAEKALSDFSMLAWDRCLDACGATERALARRAEVDAMLQSYASDLPRFHPDTWPAIYELTLRMGHDPQYKQQLMRWHAGWLGRVFPQHVCMGGLKLSLAEQHLREGELAIAREHAEDAVSCVNDALGPQSALTANAELFLARVYLADGEPARGLDLAKSVLARFDRGQAAKMDEFRELSHAYTGLLLDGMQYAEAEAFAAKCFAAAQPLGVYHPEYTLAALDLAHALVGQARTREAEQLLGFVTERVQPHLPADHPLRRRLDEFMLRLSRSEPS